MLDRKSLFQTFDQKTEAGIKEEIQPEQDELQMAHFYIFFNMLCA